MASRGSRLAIFLPVLVTVLLAAVVGALIVVQNQRESDQVAEADAAAEAFLSDVGMFRDDALRDLLAARESGPGQMRKVLKAATAEPPQLREAPDGAERSDAYVEAVRRQRTFMQPYRHLDRELRQAEIATTFIAAARDVLKLRVSEILGTTVVGDSAAVRSRLIPTFVAARDELATVRVPTGQEALAATVRGAVQHVIDQANALAASVDANRSFSFSYGEQFQAAIDAVDDYATTVEGDVTEALDVLKDE